MTESGLAGSHSVFEGSALCASTSRPEAGGTDGVSAASSPTGVPLEYDARVAHCARVGCEHRVWRIKVRGAWHTRLLCVVCSRTIAA